MDTSANPMPQQQVQTPVDDQAQNAVPQPAAQQPVSVPLQPHVSTPPYPISGPHKEFGPVVEAPVHEYIQPVETAVELHPEVKEAGVEAVPNHEQPQLQAEHTAVGIEPAKDAVPVPQAPTGAVTLPSLQQVVEERKHLQTSDAKYWWDTAIIKYLKSLITGGPSA